MGDNDEYQPVEPIVWGPNWAAFGLAALVGGAVVGGLVWWIRA